MFMEKIDIIYMAWTLINMLLIFAGLWLNRRAEKMLDESKFYLDKDEKLNEEMNKTIEEWERRIRVHEELEKIADKWKEVGE